MSNRKPVMKEVMNILMDSHRKIRCASCKAESKEISAERLQKILFSMGIFAELEGLYTPNGYADNEIESPSMNEPFATYEDIIIDEQSSMAYASDAEVSSRHMARTPDVFYDKYRTKITQELERKAKDIPLSCQIVYNALESLLIAEKEGMDEEKLSQINGALRIVENCCK